MTKTTERGRGNPNIQELAEGNRAAADEMAVAIYRKHVASLTDDGLSHAAIARALNERGVSTARGGKWHKTTVTRLITRAEQLGAVGSDSVFRLRLTDRQVILLDLAATRYLESNPRQRGDTTGERRFKARLEGLELPQPRFVGDEPCELELPVDDWLALRGAASEVLEEIDSWRTDIAARPQASSREVHWNPLLMIQTEDLRAAVARLPRR